MSARVHCLRRSVSRWWLRVRLAHLAARAATADRLAAYHRGEHEHYVSVRNLWIRRGNVLKANALLVETTREVDALIAQRRAAREARHG